MIRNQYSEIDGISEYTNNKQSERETKKTIPFTIAITKNKVPRNKFNQGGKRSVFGKL